MARKTRKMEQDPSSDDDSPEVVSHSTSKADAKRAQKALQNLESEEKARKKARNRERDHKLKERARVTRGEQPREKSMRVRFMDQPLGDEGEAEDSEEGSAALDDVEARMLRAMKDAAREVESDEDEVMGFTLGRDPGEGIASGSGLSSQDEDEDDIRMLLGESNLTDPEAPTDDDEMDEDEETLLEANIRKPNGKKADYLADDLFAAAFASQSSNPPPKKSTQTTRQETVKKQRRKSNARPKDLVIGGRTIRTLPRPSDPRSEATARTVPSARVRRFVDQSLAMKGKQGLLKAKKKGWERRPVNVGVMKNQGAPHGFVRNTRQ